MRLIFILATASSLFMTSTSQATVMLMNCKDGNRSYELRYDDDPGSLVSVIDGNASQLNIRSLKSESGVITILGTLADRGWDYTFIYRFTPSITYQFANGGKRTDACEVTGRRSR
jgi:hypothetical protein